MNAEQERKVRVIDLNIMYPSIIDIYRSVLYILLIQPNCFIFIFLKHFAQNRKEMEQSL